MRSTVLTLPWLVLGAGLAAAALAWGADRNPGEIRLASTIGPIDAGIVGPAEMTTLIRAGC